MLKAKKVLKKASWKGNFAFVQVIDWYLIDDYYFNIFYERCNKVYYKVYTHSAAVYFVGQKIQILSDSWLQKKSTQK